MLALDHTTIGIFAIAGFVSFVLPILRAFAQWFKTGSTLLDRHFVEQVFIWMFALIFAFAYAMYKNMSG